MNTQPCVSVIVPVYNVAEFLEGCLESILAQTYRDYEVICVNDGSTDASGEIAEQYAEKDKRIRVIHQENKGLSAARNTGLKAARGTFISFLDSDDYIHPQFLEYMLFVIEREKTDIVACTLVHSKEKYQPLPHSFTPSDIIVTRLNETFYNFLNRKDMVSNVCVKLYRRSVIDSLRFIEGIYFEDVPFTIATMHQAHSIALTNMPFYYYYRNMNSIMRSSFNLKKVLSYVVVIREIYQYVQQNRPEALSLVREKILNKRFKMMINQVVRKQKDKKVRRALFDEIQKQVQTLFKEGLISYDGLKFHHKIALYLLLHAKNGRPAYLWMTLI